MPERPPSGTVTFLFSDIEDSTRLWEAAPEEMATAVEIQHSLVRNAIESHHGFVFATEGDAVRAAFSTAHKAVSAAIAAQQKLDAHPAVPFGTRIGLHTAEATERDRIYVGSEVDRVARLTTVAHGGQIVVSDATEVLVREMVALRPLGQHRLNDLDRRVTVHQILADGLPVDFPPLQGIDASVGNLPQNLSSFIGREELLADVANLVRTERLVTLAGVGGVGKTRLALEAATGLIGEFPDGVWLVELAPVVDPDSVPVAIASSLGIVPAGDGLLLDTVAEAVSGRRMLLVLDNCEHVLSAATTAVEKMLGGAGNTKILVTSREHLGTATESVVSVSPLALEGGTSSDAATLFVERAQVVWPDFGLQDPDDAAAVIEICETLDGLPLGIELAAARMASMNACEVRDRLGDRFRLLRGAGHAPERQQTLRNAVAWSFDLLDAPEREVLRIAAVFRGGFTLSSLCELLGTADEVDVLERVDSLVGKSLIAADHGRKQTRYSLFETIRHFAEEQLANGGQLEEMRDRHAAHFSQAAVGKWDIWNGPGWREAVDWVEIELGNLRAGYRWSASSEHVEVATDIAAHAGLIGFSIELFETVAWAEELVDAATAADVPRLPRLLSAAGFACFVGRADAARRNAHRAAELEQMPEYDPCEPGYATFIEALGQVYCGDLDAYVELTGAVAALPGPSRAYAIAAHLDGLQSAGRIDEALALTDEAEEAAHARANPYWVAYTQWIVGLAWSKADKKRALIVWDNCVAHVRKYGVNFFDGFLARDAARLHTTDGDAITALRLFDVAIKSAHQAGNVPQLIITLSSVPALFERLGRLDDALTLFAAMARQPNSFHHVPELSELGDRLKAKLGSAKAAAVVAVGTALDLNDTASYAREHIALARQELIQGRVERPGGLSRREVEVLRLIADGITTQHIAERLFISTKTADRHIQNIYNKIGTSNRAGATRWALEKGVAVSA